MTAITQDPVAKNEVLEFVKLGPKYLQAPRIHV
jgi:hypothetical protein